MRRIWIMCGAVLALLSGCGSGSPEASVARKLADQFYQAQLQGNIDRALTYYSPSRTPEEWRALLDNTHRQLGELKAYHFKRQEVNTAMSGRFYVFEYNTEYANAKAVSETLTLFNKVNDKETKIVSHVITAEGFRPIM